MTVSQMSERANLLLNSNDYKEDPNLTRKAYQYLENVL